ncbi:MULTISPECIES: hypothetical protein [unclassified Bradyrhizobium]|uniref:hypothetical protein n=1 Tax=unclassified Bradyrhizobium TaxID=2631580 RepID=UPI00247A4E1E|nr:MULTISPECIES: hypothetical protein [unclassified Bradyrhizobium]WGS20499.1 hypothetical protein MTX22_01255 [Bradyrhizobium sp. ISRA463]WGS27381.1 hypothetical protein MTX19_38135 [Bradyrhizobium sp. ISRA464]
MASPEVGQREQPVQRALLYYDYAIASSFTAGRFSAYPLPGRTYMVRAGATF